MMSTHSLQGGCQCRAVRFEVGGEPLLAAICHCAMCRRANAAPVVAWAMFDATKVVFTKAQPKAYASSADAKRGFCQECGTPISFTATFLPGLIDLTIGSFDNPNVITPTLHYWHESHLSWVEFADQLPRYPQLPPM